MLVTNCQLMTEKRPSVSPPVGQPIAARRRSDSAGAEPATELPPDSELLARIARDRDQEAFERLFDRHAGLVLGLLIRLLRERSVAEEILQEVFLTAWDRASRYSERRGTVKTWLLIVARSRALDLLRSQRARVDREERWTRDEIAITTAATGTSQLERSEDEKRLGGALSALPDTQRECVELSFFSSLSQSQIAERLELPLGTVKSRYLSGMKKLRRMLVDGETSASPEPS